MDRPGRISRRGLLAGGTALLGTGAFVEYESLDGRFDHRYSPGASGKPRYAASLEALDRAGSEGVARASVLHVGHSTHLLCIGGLRLLTDPWFYDPAFGALKHELPPAVLPSEIGRLDVVLVTHDHADHADARAMDEMDKRATVLVATARLAVRVDPLVRRHSPRRRQSPRHDARGCRHCGSRAREQARHSVACRGGVLRSARLALPRVDGGASALPLRRGHGP